jgi:hypothetical protein
LTGLPTIAVLHAPYGAANLAEIVRAARDVCRLRFVFRHEVAALHPGQPRLASALGECTVLDEQGELPRAFAADGCLTFTDSEIDHADRFAATISGAPRPADSPWDKLSQRTALHRAGLSTVEFVRIDTAADLLTAAEVLGFPFVLKPRRGVGGRGVRVIRDRDTLNGLRAEGGVLDHHLAESWLPDGRHPANDPVLADFVSVEMLSVGGRHQPLAVFDKAPVSYLPRRDGLAVRVTGDLYPARLPGSTRRDVVRLVTRALATLGVANRLTHTEVKLTAHGPEIIEVNGRVGGDLARLTAAAGGPDLVRSALLAALRTEPAAGRPADMAAAGIYPGFADTEGTVRATVTRSAVLHLPGVVRVDHVAGHGCPRSDANGRAVDAVVTATDAERLAGCVARFSAAVAGLFATERLVPNRWLSACAGRSTPSEPATVGGTGLADESEATNAKDERTWCL